MKFNAWLLVDDKGTYAPTLHLTRREASTDLKEQAFIRDAKWRVARVEVKEVKARRTSTSTRKE